MWVCGRGTHSFASSATNLKVSGKMDRMDGMGCGSAGWACRGLGNGVRVTSKLERCSMDAGGAESFETGELVCR